MEKRGKREKSAKKLPRDYEHTIKLLVENDIALQKKLVNLAEEIQELNKNFARFFKLVETASDELVHKNKPVHRTLQQPAVSTEAKIDDLIKQNKTISRGLILLEKYVKEKLGKKTEEEDEEYKPLPDFKF